MHSSPSVISEPPRPSPASILFLLRFLHPISLLLAAFFAFTIPTIPYLLFFLFQQYTPSYTIRLSTFPAPLLLTTLAYALLNTLAHITLSALIATSVLNPSASSAETLLSLGVPRYDLSPWQGIRLIVPHLAVLLSSLLCLLAHVPPDHHYAGKRFLLAWLARRRAIRRRAAKNAADAAGARPAPALPPLRSPGASSAADDDISFTSDCDVLTGVSMPKMSRELYVPPVTKFDEYVARRGGLFWSTVATGLVGVSYSSLLTFVFLATFSSVVAGWAFQLRVMIPSRNPRRYLRMLRVFRLYVMAYLVLLVCFQLPWLVKRSMTPDTTVASVLQLLGFMPVDTAVDSGWTYVMALGAAVATYVLTGVFETSLRALSEARGVDDAEGIAEGEGQRPVDEEVPALQAAPARRRPSYYELQFLLVVVHASSIGLLAWALVFPGIFTLPLLLAALLYLGLQRYRSSPIFRYLSVYVIILQMVHYLFMAVIDAFDIDEGKDPAVVQLLGLGVLHPQFSVNIIETIAVTLLGINIFSRHYLAEMQKFPEGSSEQDTARSMDIEEFVHWSLFSSKSRNRDSLYTPIKLCLDQLALFSLYLAGGLDITALNAVFLVGLTIICILQSFGLFRRPKIFFYAWAAILLYSVIFLLITGTFCRAVDSLWMCTLEFEGIKAAGRGQVVAYAAMVVLASVQVNFTWPYDAVVGTDYVKEFDTGFWRFLRKYFLYVSYATLLLYPLVFPANFVSYGYVLFLFLSIGIELIIPSLRGREKDVRELVKKYWLSVVIFSGAAMLSRYSVRLKWFDTDGAARWIFGLETGDSRKFAITLGDALVLIAMSLQGRLFVVDKLIAEDIQRPNQGKDAEDVSAVTADTENVPLNAGFSDLTGDSSSHSRNTGVPRHRRYKSMEEYLDEEFSMRIASMLPAEPGVPTSPPTRAQSIPEGLNMLTAEAGDAVIQKSSAQSLTRGSPRDTPSDWPDIPSAEQKQTELEQVRRVAGVEQALQMFRNFRKSVPIRQTEHFLQEVCIRGMLLIRNGLLKYGYVLEALAILGASVWLPGVSVFGALYIALGSVIMLSEQSTVRGVHNPTSTHRIAKTMPAFLVILSFSLMSAQYIFLIIHFIGKVDQSSVATYIGLQTPDEPGPLPITVEAMIAHVLVFVMASVQRVAVRWARNDAEKLREEERGTSQLRDPLHVVESARSAEALDSAVPIESVIEGVGGQLEDTSHKESDARDFATGAYESNWAETMTWKAGIRQFPLAGGSIDDDSSAPSASSEPSGSKKGSEQDKIEKFRSLLKRIVFVAYKHTSDVLSLLVPFWSHWGFDVTFTYLIFCGAVTTTVFSVLYVTIVLLAAGLQRHVIRKHWHQVTLLLAGLLLCQYLLTLGLPPEAGQSLDDIEIEDAWRQWLLLDRDNTSAERKLALMFAFLAVICAGITLNSVSDGPRRLRYWIRNLEIEVQQPLDKEQAKSQLGSQDSDARQQHRRVPMGREDFEDDSRSSSDDSGVVLRVNSGDCSQSGIGDSEGEEGQSQTSLSHFISGLGGIRNLNVAGNTSQESDGVSWKMNLAQDSSGNRLAGRSYQPMTLSSNPQLPAYIDDDALGVDSLGDPADKESKDVEKKVFAPNDPNDFTRRPISFKNKVKLSWMRFAGTFVQLYIFAVASVDTNVLSGLLLAMAFSFIFQFTNVPGKKKRFMIVRSYVIFFILVLVIFQAPFEAASDTDWESIVGLLKKDTERGEKVLYLLVSLWILCQIQGRIYESQDFRFVEKYCEEDAKVRFKRAVHEHNSQKYEKMLDRNKGERSLLGRKARLERLKALQQSEKTVDAFYNVCVTHEIEVLRKQAESSKSEANKFRCHRFPEEETDTKLKPEALSFWSRFVRRLLRGKTWKQHIAQPLKSEVKRFALRYSAWPVYLTMLLAAVANPSITTLIYPITLFLYLIVEQPRPPKQAWTLLMAYVCAAIALKYIFRSTSFSFCSNVAFFAPGGSDERIPSVQNFEGCTPAAGIGFDIFVLLALLGHRATLYSRGLWDLVMSEEDMLLRSEIRGRECETPHDMEYVAKTPTQALDNEGNAVPSSPSYRADLPETDNVWDAEQQYEDVEHILSQARRDILGEAKEQVRFARNVEVTPVPPTRDRPVPASVRFRPGAMLRAHDARVFADGSLMPSEKHTTSKPFPTIPLPDRNVVGGMKPEKDFWSRPPVDQQPPGSRVVPKSAPVFVNRSRGNDPRAPPSTQGSDAFRSNLTLNRLRSFRLGSLRDTGAYNNAPPMTAAQSRVHEALIQGKIIPKQGADYRRSSLSLFDVEQRGTLSRIRQYFLRLTKENDHKAVGDYYLLIFVVDFISFVYVMFGFSAIFGDSSSGRDETWWTTNFIETRHLLTLFVMFISLILDRIFYLTRSMTGKLILQYSSVIAYHVVLFVVQEHIGTRSATRIFYILRCIYFLLSGLQIRDGFPLYTTAQFLLRQYSTLGIVMFEIYIFVPFLWLSRTLLDWTVLPTSLEIFQYFRFIDIYLWLYRNRAVNMSRGSFRRKLGEKRRMLPRVYQGVGLFLLCVIALFLPFMIFSIFNPFFVGRELRSSAVTVNLLTFDQSALSGGRSYEIFSRTAVVGSELSSREREAAAAAVGVILDVREKENVFEAWFSPISDSLWQPPNSDKEDLVQSLQMFDGDTATKSPQLAFTLSTSTTDRITFGTREQLLNLTVEQARNIALAVDTQQNFAMKVQSPLSRYSVLQSGGTVFESASGNDGREMVCIQLVHSGQNGNLAFWTMGDCPDGGSCTCEDNQSDSMASDVRHILQIADISALQLGGATILTLYTAILFTIANLLKRFFIDKRLIIPYIDMPYTLHLYQLVLDIMYARQDNQLEMEEILYNGLMDIYRNQNEIVRWTGERALKLPEAWWDGNEVENPFMVYPSFAETATEPYIERKVE